MRFFGSRRANKVASRVFWANIRAMFKKPFRAKFLLYSSAQFVVMTFAAMAVFPGGALYSPGARRYLFLENFFSDLGGTLNRRGQSNELSMALFVIALAMVGISLALSSPMWRQVVGRSGKGTRWGYGAQLLCALAGVCYVGIAVTPWNLVLPTHMLFVQAAFSLLLGFVICLTVVQLKNDWPMRFVMSNCAYCVVLTCYVFVLFRGPNLATLRGLMFQVIAQKIIVYASVTNLGYQAYGVANAERLAPARI